MVGRHSVSSPKSAGAQARVRADGRSSHGDSADARLRSPRVDEREGVKSNHRSERNLKGSAERRNARLEKVAQGPGGGGSKEENHDVRAAVFMLLLALQIGVQPVLVKECIDKERVILVSVVVGQELMKVVECMHAFIMLIKVVECKLIAIRSTFPR
jgi:hypothetical protein